MRDQVRKQRVRADVERHAQECIRRSLIKLAMKKTFARTVLDLKLKERMTGRQIDVVTFARIPAADDQSARIGIRFDLVNQPRDLIDAIAFWIVPAERSPEISINRAHVTGFTPKSARVLPVSPLFPDVDSLLSQIGFVRVTG